MINFFMQELTEQEKMCNESVTMDDSETYNCIHLGRDKDGFYCMASYDKIDCPVVHLTINPCLDESENMRQ